MAEVERAIPTPGPARMLYLRPRAAPGPPAPTQPPPSPWTSCTPQSPEGCTGPKATPTLPHQVLQRAPLNSFGCGTPAHVWTQVDLGAESVPLKRVSEGQGLPKDVEQKPGCPPPLPQPDIIRLNPDFGHAHFGCPRSPALPLPVPLRQGGQAAGRRTPLWPRPQGQGKGRSGPAGNCAAPVADSGAWARGENGDPSLDL